MQTSRYPGKNTVFVMLTIALLSLFFIDPPVKSSDLWFQYFWNCGHYFVFAFISWRMAGLLSPRLPPLVTLSCVYLTIAIIGAGIELIQFFTHREPSFSDFLFDLAGASGGLYFSSAFRSAANPSDKSISKITFYLGLFYILWTPYALIIDTFITKHQFPVILDFSTPFEENRLSGNAKFEVIKDSKTCSHCLTATFDTRQYSTLHIRNFYPDWQGYNYLVLDTYLPGNQDLRVNLSFYDAHHHLSGSAFTDRFTNIYHLKPGHNQLIVPLDHAKHSPLDRSLDLSRIEQISIYTMSLAAKRTIFLNKISLK